jgi:hypothetical protein
VLSGDGPDRTEPRFQPGDTVRVAAPATRGHTRCPGYVRGRTGTVVRIDPGTPLPDGEAHSPDGRAQSTHERRRSRAGRDEVPSSRSLAGREVNAGAASRAATA